MLALYVFEDCKCGANAALRRIWSERRHLGVGALVRERSFVDVRPDLRVLAEEVYLLAGLSDADALKSRAQWASHCSIETFMRVRHDLQRSGGKDACLVLRVREMASHNDLSGMFAWTRMRDDDDEDEHRTEAEAVQTALASLEL